MLTREENALLTHTNRGTPMGEYLRRYWQPVLLASELLEPDCPPVRVKLMGEELVAFRDTQDRIGLLDEYCTGSPASTGAATRSAACAASTTAGSSTWKGTAWICPTSHRSTASR